MEMSNLDELMGEGFSKEAAENAAASAKRVGGKTPYFKFKDGNNVVRILPALRGESSPIVVTWQHFLKNFGGGTKALSFNCPRQMGGGRCPACEQRELLNSSDNPADQARARDFAPKVRAHARVIDRADEAAGVQIMAFPSTILERLNELRQNDDEYGEDYTHPLEGDDILIVRKKDNKGWTTYSVAIRKKGPQELSPDREQIVAWMTPGNVPDLSRLAQVLTYDKIREIGESLKAEAQGALTSGPTPRAIEASAIDSFDSGTAESAVGDPAAMAASTAF